MKIILLVLTMVLLLGGCATSRKTSKVQLGMTKDAVTRVMGKPVSVSAQGDAEYLNYSLSETSDDAVRGWTRPYYIRLINGKVDSYGRTGDFDSTKKTIRVELETTSAGK